MSRASQHQSYLLLVLVLFAIGAGQTFAKLGMNQVQSGQTKAGVFMLVAGYAFLGFRGIIWLLLLRVMNLSKAYSLQSLSYVIVFLISVFVFHESVSVNKVLGCMIILSGVLLIGTERK